MNEELFNEATKSNVLTKKLIDQLLESMSYSSISFINWTIETCLLYTSFWEGPKPKGAKAMSLKVLLSHLQMSTETAQLPVQAYYSFP